MLQWVLCSMMFYKYYASYQKKRNFNLEFRKIPQVSFEIERNAIAGNMLSDE